jgi:hypothetical protein
MILFGDDNPKLPHTISHTDLLTALYIIGGDAAVVMWDRDVASTLGPDSLPTDRTFAVKWYHNEGVGGRVWLSERSNQPCPAAWPHGPLWDWYTRAMKWVSVKPKSYRKS